MTKNVTIVWGAIAPWDDSKTEARSIRIAYLESKFQAGLTTAVEGTRTDNTVVRNWANQTAAEEEVAYVSTFANTYGLDLNSVIISDPA